MAGGSAGFVVAAHEGPVWDMQQGRPTIFKLLAEQTGGRIAVFEEVVPPGGRTALHIHHTSDEVIHIVSGEFTVRLGAASHRVTAGAWVFIPRGSVHGWRNSGSEDGRAHFIFTPADGARTFEDMRHEGRYIHEIDEDRRQMYFGRHGMELVSRDWT
ncbi:cupin domain-containing protein [Paracraurococcus ruber]|nr:cupin domain-containing protein [Paracraurococcus ruber]